jgi:CRP-like cAMP-binding protein
MPRQPLGGEGADVAPTLGREPLRIGRLAGFVQSVENQIQAFFPRRGRVVRRMARPVCPAPDITKGKIGSHAMTRAFPARMTWDNHFLDSLAGDDLDRLRDDLVEVALGRSQLLDEAGRPIAYVYLPRDCILSVLTVMKDGSQVESRTVGRESGYGLLQAIGAPMSYERTITQVAGRSWRLPLPVMRAASAQSPTLREAIARHAQATIIQAAQSTACNTLHKAEQRLCRWLLLTQDRLGSDVLPLTQEHLAIMLGVQRTTVTATASRLQERGFVRYARGRIRILDRPGLLRCTCECYEAIEAGVRLMLGDR